MLNYSERDEQEAVKAVHHKQEQASAGPRPVRAPLT